MLRIYWCIYCPTYCSIRYLIHGAMCSIFCYRNAKAEPAGVLVRTTQGSE